MALRFGFLAAAVSTRSYSSSSGDPKKFSRRLLDEFSRRLLTRLRAGESARSKELREVAASRTEEILSNLRGKISGAKIDETLLIARKNYAIVREMDARGKEMYAIMKSRSSKMIQFLQLTGIPALGFAYVISNYS